MTFAPHDSSASLTYPGNRMLCFRRLPRPMHYPNDVMPKDCHWLLDDRSEQAMIETLLGSPMATLLLDLFNDGRKTKELRRAIRARLRREAKFNLEVLALLERRGLPLQDVVAALDFSAMKEVFFLPVPIEKILGVCDLSPEVVDILNQRGDVKPNGRYRRWTRGIVSEADLLERIWQRVAVLRVRVRHNLGRGDPFYLKLLIRAFERSLASD